MHGLELIAFELLNGVVWGLILSLIALGLSLMFGVLRIINIAHGSFYMLGAVISAALIEATGISFWICLIVAPVCVAVLCLVFNWALFERIFHRSSAIGLLATAGLLLVIDNTVLALFGGAPHSIVTPLPKILTFFGIRYPVFRLVAALGAILILTAVWAFLRFSRYGLWMRAVPQARELAAAVGVPIKRVNRYALVLVGLTAGFAGALVVPISGAYFAMGLTVLASAFVIVVVGGLDNLLGVTIIAILFGVARGLFTAFMSPSWAEILALAILFPLLYFKPNGIFGAR